MKGIEKYERDSKRGANLVKQEVEVEVQGNDKKKENKYKIFFISHPSIHRYAALRASAEKDIFRSP